MSNVDWLEILKLANQFNAQISFLNWKSSQHLVEHPKETKVKFPRIAVASGATEVILGDAIDMPLTLQMFRLENDLWKSSYLWNLARLLIVHID